jgi:hypothetical protein
MNIAAPKSIIDGQVFIPYPVSYVFVLTGELSSSIDINRMIVYAEKLQNELKNIEKDKTYEFVKNFIYPYKTDRSQEIDKTKKQTIINIASGAVKATRIIKDARINWAIDPCVVVDDSNDLPPDFTGEIITFPLQKIVIKLLTNQINSAEIMLAMIKTYKDDMIKSHTALWNLK